MNEPQGDVTRHLFGLVAMYSKINYLDITLGEITFHGLSLGAGLGDSFARETSRDLVYVFVVFFVDLYI